MPVHDALIQLEKEGLVVSKPDARYVIELTERDIRELYRVRLALEKVAVELAAQNTSPANRLALCSKLEEMKKGVGDQDYRIYTQSDVDMHSLIWHQSDNRHLESILQTMIGPIFMFVAYNAERFDWNETLQLHTNLVSCISAGDAIAAVESITLHLDIALNRSLKIFQNQT
jgi:GntR family transcriptional regulator of gluconate operon